MVYVVGCRMAPKMSTAQTLEPVNMLPYLGKRDFADGIKLRILKFGP